MLHQQATPVAEHLTARLRLRPWREEDGLELERLFSDPDVVGGRIFPPERIARFNESTLRQWRVHGFGPWAALDKATGVWIGRIGLDYLGWRRWTSASASMVSNGSSASPPPRT